MSDGIYKNILETMDKPSMNRRTFLKVGTIAVAAVVFPGCLKSGSSTPEIADYLTGDAVVDKYMFPLVDEAIKNGNNAALANYKELGTNLKKQAGEIRSQYSVPVDLAVVRYAPLGNQEVLFFKPLKVDQDAIRQYNLKNYKEATYALANTIHSNNVPALELLTSDRFKEKLRQDGDSLEVVLNNARKTFDRLVSKEPEPFDIRTVSLDSQKATTELLYLDAEAYRFDFYNMDGLWLL